MPVTPRHEFVELCNLVIGDADVDVRKPGLRIKYPISARHPKLLNPTLSHTLLRCLAALSPARVFTI
jgi:hypothetical protein